MTISGNMLDVSAAKEKFRGVRFGNAACANCNLSGPSIFFAVHSKHSRIFYVMLTLETVKLISAYSRNIYARTGTTWSVATSLSTKLKFQPSLS
ncbi:hypothetical protein Ct61P_15165 [Colletotrichum tofieldiae]|nr:hypothetical protein Ct61P_15165 [Colletotrichum tofieldiae]